MIYLYDRAICEDLEKSFTDEMGTSAVKVVSPEQTSAVIAQIKESRMFVQQMALLLGRGQVCLSIV